MGGDLKTYNMGMRYQYVLMENFNAFTLGAAKAKTVHHVESWNMIL
jgi:hypothetical protein